VSCCFPGTERLIHFTPLSSIRLNILMHGDKLAVVQKPQITLPGIILCGLLTKCCCPAGGSWLVIALSTDFAALGVKTLNLLMKFRVFTHGALAILYLGF
jgi:hypothetical protein